MIFGVCLLANARDSASVRIDLLVYDTVKSSVVIINLPELDLGRTEPLRQLLQTSF